VDCGTGQWDGWFTEAVFTIPIACLTFTAALLLGYVLFRIWWIMGVRGLYKHWRIAAFLVHGLTSFTYLCLYQWIFVHGRHNTTRVSIIDWLTCRATHLDASACYAPGSVPGAESFPAAMSNVCVACFIPIIFAAILLSDPEIALHWYDSFRRYVLRQRVPDRWADQKRALKLSKAVGSSSSLSRLGSLSSGDASTGTLGQ